MGPEPMPATVRISDTGLLEYACLENEGDGMQLAGK